MESILIVIGGTVMHVEQYADRNGESSSGKRSASGNHQFSLFFPWLHVRSHNSFGEVNKFSSQIICLRSAVDELMLL